MFRVRNECFVIWLQFFSNGNEEILMKFQCIYVTILFNKKQ